MDKIEKLISVRNIKKSFGRLHTLEDVSLDLYKNQFVSILGPSGCGKSTLFDIISGLEVPDVGTVFIDGLDYNGRTGRVSYMHQKDLLFPWNNILDNVSLPLRIKGIKKRMHALKRLTILLISGSKVLKTIIRYSFPAV